MPPADPPVEAGPSRIAGFGLFAAAALPAGTVLAEIDRDRLNHSCDPNLGWTPDGQLVTMRDVAVGDELTTDYALHITDPGFVLTCHCETYRCRQVIEGTDWQIPQLQRRYRGYWAPAVRRRIASGSC